MSKSPHIEDMNRHDFVRWLPLIMSQAGKVGLYKTMHTLHEAVRVAGWELAERMEKESDANRDHRKPK